VCRRPWNVICFTWATLLAAAVTSFFWSRYPYTRGSYTSPKVGQYTTMLDEAGKPALNGRLQFAGEHTCGGNFVGYMDGAVLSGNRTAARLAEIMALHK
jgi:monoamine oxidase